MALSTSVLAYLVAITIYKVIENLTLARYGLISKIPLQYPALLYITIPFLSVLFLPIGELYYYSTNATLIFWGLGGLFILLAMLMRVRSYKDLSTHYQKQKTEQHNDTFVSNGVYAIIRHPIYLSNVFLYIGCPLFLLAKWTWLVSLLGLLGILLMITKDESLMKAKYADYDMYIKKTWALLPKIF